MIRFDCTLTRPAFTLDATFDSIAGITGLIGPSGSGKSTIIQLIAGLARSARGHIQIGETVLLDTARGISLPPHKRCVGLVFQDAQLFPHLSVRQNLDYGHRFAQSRNTAITLDAVTSVLGIEHLLQRAPINLSGGERQRVAIGRALLASPKLLLMDEPLASLDTSRKLEILPFIERLRDEFQIPILYVSHAAEEIARLATTVIRLDKGKVTATGSPTQILMTGLPAPDQSARFEALSTITGSNPVYDSRFATTALQHPAGTIIVPGHIGPSSTTALRIVVRASNVALATARPAGVSIRTVLEGRITQLEESGPYALVTIALVGGDAIAAYVTRLALHDLNLKPGSTVFALIKSVTIDERGLTSAQS